MDSYYEGLDVLLSLIQEHANKHDRTSYDALADLCTSGRRAWGEVPGTETSTSRPGRRGRS